MARRCRVHWYSMDTGRRVSAQTMKTKLSKVYTGHEYVSPGRRRRREASYEGARYQVCKDGRYYVDRYIGIVAGSPAEITFRSLRPYLKK